MHLFIGVGASATFGPMMADMSQWFVRHRGIAIGAAASGNYIGGALWPPVLQQAIVDRGLAPHLSRRRGALRAGDTAIHFCVAATRTGASDRVDVRDGD